MKEEGVYISLRLLTKIRVRTGRVERNGTKGISLMCYVVAIDFQTQI